MDDRVRCHVDGKEHTNPRPRHEIPHAHGAHGHPRGRGVGNGGRKLRPHRNCFEVEDIRVTLGPREKASSNNSPHNNPLDEDVRLEEEKPTAGLEPSARGSASQNGQQADSVSTAPSSPDRLSVRPHARQWADPCSKATPGRRESGRKSRAAHFLGLVSPFPALTFGAEFRLPPGPPLVPGACSAQQRGGQQCPED